MRRTASSGINMHVLASYESEELRMFLRVSKLSLIVDETTDQTATKCLVLIIKYWNCSTEKVREEFLGLLEVEDTSNRGKNYYRHIPRKIRRDRCCF